MELLNLDWSKEERTESARGRMSSGALMFEKACSAEKMMAGESVWPLSE